MWCQKIYLLVQAWSSWVTLLSILYYYFSDITVVVFMTSYVGVGFAMTFCSKLLYVWLVPERVKAPLERFWEGNSGKNRQVTLLASMMLLPSVVSWWTWHWSWKGGLVRTVTFLAACNMMRLDELAMIGSQVLQWSITKGQQAWEYTKDEWRAYLKTRMGPPPTREGRSGSGRQREGSESPRTS